MTARSNLHGSYGMRQPFGRRGSGAALETPIRRPDFGKRTKVPALPVSLQRERLRGLYAELMVIFSDPAFPEIRPELALVDSADNTIALGNDARIEIEPDTGAFVFRWISKGSQDVLSTTSVDRLMDVVVAHFARRNDASPDEAGLAFVEKNVGRTIKDVERALILATLRRCNGNRTHTARMLGISLRTLRNKLHGYWDALLPDSESHSSNTVHEASSAITPRPG